MDKELLPMMRSLVLPGQRGCSMVTSSVMTAFVDNLVGRNKREQMSGWN